MEEKISKKFLLYFRLALLCWILIANAILHIIGFSYGWLIFISNIMLFTLEGDVKERFLTVEIGGLVGLVLTVLAMLAISALTPIVGDLFGLLHHAGDRPVATASAGKGDRAVGTEIIASVLHFQEMARTVVCRAGRGEGTDIFRPGSDYGASLFSLFQIVQIH